VVGQVVSGDQRSVVAQSRCCQATVCGSFMGLQEPIGKVVVTVGRRFQFFTKYIVTYSS
jgi:hypothetical protein